ncbi:MAG: hydroxylase [Myxococcales bacterium]|nr:hydroxylase [Myxococcales bacterium]
MKSPLLEHALALAPRLRAAAPVHETMRRVSPELGAELGARGYFRMLAPRVRGGLEARPTELVAVLEALALGDAATAWCVMTAATTSYLAAYLPAEGAARMLADPAAGYCGVFAPAGRATPIAGGYRLTGRWPFASGCELASWRMGGALVMTPEGPRRTPAGAVELRLMLFPAAASRVIDTWTVAGLQGTGSHDIAVDDLDVPEDMTTCLALDAPVAGDLYKFPIFGLLADGVAAVALGIGRAAIDAFRQQIEAPRRSTGKPRALDSSVQVELVRAEAELRAARALLFETLADVEEAAQQEGSISLERRALLRMSATHATRAAARVVDALYLAAGGAAVYARSPLQRHLRDVHTITQHIMVAPGGERLIGRALLGLAGDYGEL